MLIILVLTKLSVTQIEEKYLLTKLQHSRFRFQIYSTRSERRKLIESDFQNLYVTAQNYCKKVKNEKHLLKRFIFKTNICFSTILD